MEKARGGNVEELLKQKGRDIQKQEQRANIMRSNYNPRYKYCITDELPKYLRGRGGRTKIKAIARLICGNEEERNRYWLPWEKRLCRLCKRTMGSFEHLIDECVKGVEGNIRIEDLLDEKGGEGAVKWIGQITKERKRIKTEKKREWIETRGE